MGRYSLLGALALLCVLPLVVPADAITIAGTHYVLFARTTITIKSGETVIPGDVGVNDAGGLLRVGAFNDIVGTATADRMSFGRASHVTGCDFYNAAGVDPRAVCDGHKPPIGFPITTWPPFSVPTVPSCVDTGPDVVVPHRGFASLDPGCHGDVRIGDGATLTLAAGIYDFKSIRLENGSRLDGNGAIVNVNRLAVSAPAVVITSVVINSSATSRGVVVDIGNRGSLEDVVLYAPNGTVHLRREVVVDQVQVVARRIIVGSITVVMP